MPPFYTYEKLTDIVRNNLSKTWPRIIEKKNQSVEYGANERN